MNRHFSAGLIIAGLVGAAGMALPKVAKGQGPSGQQQKTHVIVVHDVIYVHTQPLREMKQIPPPHGQPREVPFHHPLPVQARPKAGTFHDPALQQSSGALVSTTNGLSFLGVGDGFANYPGDQYAPPDTSGAAGATQYVQWVNVNFAIFNKSTGAVEEGPVSGNTLWQGLGTGSACYTDNDGDIIAKYDQVNRRWVMMQPVFSSPYYLCVAVSQTSDATGAWNLYQFPIADGGFPDYPKLGVWSDGYYVTYNDFGANGNSFQGGYACALDSARMIAGSAATMQCFNSGYPSLLPSDLDGDSGAPGSTQAPPAGAPDYFIDFSGGSSLNLWQFHVDWAAPSNSTFTGPAVIPVDAFSEACGGGTCIPQPGTNQQLDSLGDRLMYRFAYRNFGGYESLVVSQSVDTGSGNTGVRWYEIRSPGSSPYAYQQGTFAPDSNDRWMPSIAEDEKGDIAVGYSESSSGTYPQIDYTGRLAGDAPGTMQSEATIQTGSGSQLPSLNRWGDYSSMSVDPSDDCTFWYTTEYLQSNGTFNWSTQIASFSFPGCAAPPTPDFSLSSSPNSQTVTQGGTANYTITVSPMNGFTGNVTLSASNLPTGATDGFTGNPVDITTSSSGTATFSVDTTSVAPGTYTIDVAGAGPSTNHTIPVGLTVQGPTSSDFTLTATPATAAAQPGSNTSYQVTIAGSTPGDPYNGTVSLSVTGVPGRTSSSFSPASVSGSGNSTLTLSPNRKATKGSYTLTITGTSGSLVHSEQVTFIIGTLPTPGFSLSGSPSSQTVNPGSGTSYTITATPSNGFTGSVTLSVAGAPSGVTTGFSPNPVGITSTSSQTSTLTISTTSGVAPGSYTLTVSGVSGSTNASTQVTLVVQNAGADFTISVSPSSRTIAPNSSTTYTVTVTAVNGFAGTVNFGVSGLPGQTSSSFSPTSVTGSGSSTLTIKAVRKAHAGTSTLTITGTSGSLSHSATTSLTIT